MTRKHFSEYLKTESHELPLDRVLQSPVTVLNGVSREAAEALTSIDVRSVFDLAHSTIFTNARGLAFPSENDVFRETRLIPSDVVDNRVLENGSALPWGARPIIHLQGIGERNQPVIAGSLHVETIRDLALWPPFLAAREIAGFAHAEARVFVDEGIPQELVPKFNEYASEKSFYAVYVIDAAGVKAQAELTQAVSLDDPALTSAVEVPRTGAILRYEQSWTPVALTLGNLLHSLALAPGESTRIAIIDWTRRQGVRTTEDVSQLEALSNSLMQTRSISEVTRAVAREAQRGFSSMNSNSTVSNNAYSSFGLQNAEQALAATAAGVASGGAAGATAGGIAGAGIGVVAGGVTGGFGAGIGAIPGMILGGFAGGAIGAGAGGLIGGTAGGVGAFLGTADFGSGQGSDSTTTVEAVTTTSSSGEREVAAEMAQNIDDRTHQHASTSRNRHAAIVQEVSQQENEQISTRVVTNYNHMHALTIQYFEVVQVYNVRTTLVQKQDCLYIPFLPIQWTQQLVFLCRSILLRYALTPEAAYTLVAEEKTVVLSSPTYGRLPDAYRTQVQRVQSATDRLRRARGVTNTFVSGDPLDGWRLRGDYQIAWIWYVFEWGRTGVGGPLTAAAAAAKKELRYELILHFRDGTRRTIRSFDELKRVPEALWRLSRISRIDLRITSADFDFASALAEPEPFGVWLTFNDKDRYGDWEDYHANIDFVAQCIITSDDISEGGVTVPLIRFVHSMTSSTLLEHLNENTEYYTHQVLRTRNNPLVRRVLTHYQYGGKPLVDLVDQEPVAITGSSLVFLLHDPPAAAKRASSRYAVGSVAKNSLIPVGTGGVFAEAVQGRANSAEKLDITRFWNWQESPIPIVAPEIAPIQSGSRAMAADIRPGSLDASPLQLMATQSLPAPAGIAAALQAVQTQMFRDMSGIAHTAQLAQTALEEAVEGATTTGGQASDNLKQGLNLTRELLGKVVDMNGQFANTLAQSGFGVMSAAMGGGGAAPGLLNKGPSQVGALLNAAGMLDAKSAGTSRAIGGAPSAPRTGPGGAGGTGVLPGSGGGNGGSAPALPGGGNAGAGIAGAGIAESFGSLGRQILERAAGIIPDASMLAGILPPFAGSAGAGGATQPSTPSGLPRSTLPGLPEPGVAPRTNDQPTAARERARRRFGQILTAAGPNLPRAELAEVAIEWYRASVLPALQQANADDRYLSPAISEWLHWRATCQQLGINGTQASEGIGTAEDEAEIWVAGGLRNAVNQANDRAVATNRWQYLRDALEWGLHAEMLGLDTAQNRLSAMDVMEDFNLRIEISDVQLPPEVAKDQTVMVRAKAALRIGDNPPILDQRLGWEMEVTGGTAAPPLHGLTNAQGGFGTAVTRTTTSELQVRVSAEFRVDGFPIRRATMQFAPALPS